MTRESTEPDLFELAFPRPPQFHGNRRATVAEWDSWLNSLTPQGLSACIYCDETHFPSKRIALEIFHRYYWGICIWNYPYCSFHFTFKWVLPSFYLFDSKKLITKFK